MNYDEMKKAVEKIVGPPDRTDPMKKMLVDSGTPEAQLHKVINAPDIVQQQKAIIADLLAACEAATHHLHGVIDECLNSHQDSSSCVACNSDRKMIGQLLTAIQQAKGETDDVQ